MDEFVDPSYEYDAPMFVDFSKDTGDLDPEADKWFDGKVADEGGWVIEEDSCEQRSNEPNCEASKILEEVVKESSSSQNEEPPVEQKADTEPLAEAPPKKSAPKNCVTSWSEWVTKTQTTTNEQVKTESAPRQSQVRKKREKKVPERRSARLRTLSTCSIASTSSTVSSCSSDGGPAKKVPKIKAPLTLTVPDTPNFMRRVAQSKGDKTQAQKTREEQELQVIAQKQKEMMEKLKQNKVSMKKALAGQSYMPCRSAVDNLTRAKEFHFATDDRLGPSSHHSNNEGKGKDFVGSLRQHPPSPTFKNRKPTVPVPFKMNESRKRKEPENDTPCGEYQSMAQRVYQWQKKTPERFHVKPVSKQNQGPPDNIEKASLKLTAPKTPNLRSRDRKRPLSVDCMSKEEQEKIQEAEMKSYKFKATELNRKIFDCNGTLGVYMEPKKPLTSIEPFNFNTEQRAEVHKTKETQAVIEAAEPREIKANPCPDFTNVFKPELPHKGTQIQPFSFEQRDKETKLKKEEKITAILEEEKKAHENFHAQPLPSFTPPPLPSSSKLITEPVPFDLSTENRGAVKAEKWGQQLQQEIQEERMKRVFKARSTNVLYNAPFIPDKSMAKPNTKIEEFSMNSDKRAKEREVYEMHKAERDQEEEELRKQIEREREEEEKIYLKNLRKQLVHKPNPIRKYRPIEIKQSEKELTNAQSPQWHSKKRRKMRV